MTKYRLKKDTPFYKKGTEFCEDWCHKGVLLDDNCAAVANLNELDNPDEWFEEVKESGWWKPKFNEKYYYLAASGEVYIDSWVNGGLDELRYSMGACFKTKEATKRWREYLKAIATVRQDEGVLTPEQAANNGYIYYICTHNEFGPVVHGFNADYVSVNTVLFDTREHAQASLDKHPDEWEIIANYDWSRE